MISDAAAENIGTLRGERQGHRLLPCTIRQLSSRRTSVRSLSLRKRSITCTWEKVKRKIVQKPYSFLNYGLSRRDMNALAKPEWSQYNGNVKVHPGGDEVARREKYIFATEYNKKPHHIFRKLLAVIVSIAVLGFLVNTVYNYNLAIRQQITVANLPDDLEPVFDPSSERSSQWQKRPGPQNLKTARHLRIYSCVVMTGDMIWEKTAISKACWKWLRSGREGYSDSQMIPGDMDSDYLDPHGACGLHTLC